MVTLNSNSKTFERQTTGFHGCSMKGNCFSTNSMMQANKAARFLMQLQKSICEYSAWYVTLIQILNRLRYFLRKGAYYSGHNRVWCMLGSEKDEQTR